MGLARGKGVSEAVVAVDLLISEKARAGCVAFQAILEHACETTTKSNLFKWPHCWNMVEMVICYVIYLFKLVSVTIY